MSRIQKKSLDRPDETRSFPRGIGELTRVGSLMVGRGVFQPGWRWSEDVQPLTGTASCQIHHLQLLLSGQLRVQMDDGETAEFVANDVFEVPPGHDAWVVGDEPAVVLDFYGNVGEFALPSGHERVVTTLLMSDVVDSTVTARMLGDARWKQLLAEHNRIIRGQFERFRGREVNTTGDGFLATFASAAAAVRCAAAIRTDISALGIQVRIGVHTGEIELLPDDVGGMAVHAAARIMAFGGPSEVIVSAVTRALAEGSGLRFEERGSHQLKGLEQPIELFALVD
jgi:class 3 adenylate cyclase